MAVPTVVGTSQTQGIFIKHPLSPLSTNLSGSTLCALRDSLENGLRMHEDVVFIVSYTQEITENVSAQEK